MGAHHAAGGRLEGALFRGSFPIVGADLHLRFGLSFTAIGLIVGAFAIGGLIYAATVQQLMRRFGQTGLANAGGALMGLAFLVLASSRSGISRRSRCSASGFGFYMLHNTLQTNATQMTPQARGTAVALFSSMYFIGQTVGVALAALVMDRYGGAAAVHAAARDAAGAGVLVRAALEAAKKSNCARARPARSRPGRCARPGPAGCRRART